jgi:hypothetical protein
MEAWLAFKIILPLKGKFYIYIYADGIFISFNDYTTRSGLGSYEKAIRFPKNMFNDVVEFITVIEAQYKSNEFVVHIYSALTADISAHLKSFPKE